jgi:hypothetical protein
MRRSLDVFFSVCLTGMASVCAVANPTAISEGFEGPLFSAGGLNAQPNSLPALDQWLVSGSGANASAGVATSNPASGSQQVRLKPMPAQQGAKTGFFSPIIDITLGTATTAGFDIAINGVIPGLETGGSEYTIILADRAHGRKAAEMILSYTGDILVDDGGATVDTLADWSTGGYQHFQIEINPPAATITYKRNGTAFYSSGLIPIALNGSDTVDQIQFISDNFGDAGFETADFDNVTLNAVVPEPATIALLAISAWLAARRR